MPDICVKNCSGIPVLIYCDWKALYASTYETTVVTGAKYTQSSQVTSQQQQNNENNNNNNNPHENNINSRPLTQTKHTYGLSWHKVWRLRWNNVQTIASFYYHCNKTHKWYDWLWSSEYVNQSQKLHLAPLKSYVGQHCSGVTVSLKRSRSSGLK